MTRTMAHKAESLDEVLLEAAARLRARALALLDAALGFSGRDQTELAHVLGVKKSAVNQVLRGNGNITMDTLGEYLAAMGFEADLTVVLLGEMDAARDHRRAPRHVAITLADQDRLEVWGPERYEVHWATNSSISPGRQPKAIARNRALEASVTDTIRIVHMGESWAS